jgi:hypothetical protein
MRAWTRGCWPVLLVAALAQGCHRKPPAYTGPTDTYAHPIGLTLTVPRTIGRQPVTVKQTPRGFVVRCCETARYAGHVTMEFKPGVAAPLGEWPKTRTVGDIEVHYMIVDLNGGMSGGEAYEFTAWRRARDGHLLYGQDDQSELWEPDFELAWSVIEGTKLSP